MEREMTRAGIFGWDLPPGCTMQDIENAYGCRDCSPLTENILGLLEDAGCPEEINDKIIRLIEGWESRDDADYGINESYYWGYMEDVLMNAISDIVDERSRQVKLAHGGDTEAFDKANSRNDWIAYINAYTGRAANKCFRNEKEKQSFRDNMVKAAALCVAAIEAHDKGYC